MKLQDIYLLALIFCLCQVADGLLTYNGVSLFGINAEGNPLMFFLMQQFGAVETLIVTKLIAIALIVFLCIPTINCLNYRKRVAKIFRFMIVFYVIVVVCPWLIVLPLSVP